MLQETKVALLVSCLILYFQITMAKSVIYSEISPVGEILPQNDAIFNVVHYGAVGDARTDDTNAFLKAWKDACEATGGIQVVLVPQAKTFLLKPSTFSGPCKSSLIQVSVQGNLVAPITSDKWATCTTNSWLHFANITNLHVIGSGKLDGKGPSWWKQIQSNISESDQHNGCFYSPTALLFSSCNGLQLNGLTHVNSPRNHIQVAESKNVEISHLNIIAPADSPNTDGIDITFCYNVSIHDCFIGTGDDCIAIKGNTSFVNITSIRCGPGHGISIGSLGNDGQTHVVEQVNVRHCILNGTSNGARIKTYQGGSGHVSGVTFENITLVNSKYPIIIDQFYCNGRNTCTKSPRAVQVRNVTYRGFRGTSTLKEAISLRCSANVACTNLKFQNITLISSIPAKTLTTFCENAHGIILPPTTPNITCLSI